MPVLQVQQAHEQNGTTTMITIDHVSKTYASKQGEHHALKDISLTIESGDIFGILGSSGAGKSTLVRCINLLERPSSGRILIDGNDITNYRGAQLKELRQSIGMIFQNFSLFQQRTVLENITFPLELTGCPKAKREARAKELLDVVGLADLSARYPAQLSGGQQQRVAIARALANRAKIMLCDEATSALDTKTTVAILDLLKTINREFGVTQVLITHALTVAESACNKIAVIDDGRIVEQGATHSVFAHPQSNALHELIENSRSVISAQGVSIVEQGA